MLSSSEAIREKCVELVERYRGVKGVRLVLLHMWHFNNAYRISGVARAGQPHPDGRAILARRTLDCGLRVRCGATGT